MGFCKVKTVLRLGLWAKVVSYGRGLGETSGGFCGDGTPAGEKVWWRGLAVAMALGASGLGKACRRCGKFRAKAFVGFGGLGRQKGLLGARNSAKLRSGFGEAKPWRN